MDTSLNCGKVVLISPMYPGAYRVRSSWVGDVPVSRVSVICWLTLFAFSFCETIILCCTKFSQCEQNFGAHLAELSASECGGGRVRMGGWVTINQLIEVHPSAFHDEGNTSGESSKWGRLLLNYQEGSDKGRAQVSLHFGFLCCFLSAVVRWFLFSPLFLRT